MVKSISKVMLLICLWTSAYSQNETRKEIVEKPTSIDKYPFTVQISLKGSTFCAGTVISRTLVLTAAHCVVGRNPTTFRILTGSSYRNLGSSYRIRGKLVHCDFNRISHQNDIALLYMLDVITLSNSVAVAKLPTPQMEVPDYARVIPLRWGNIQEGAKVGSNQFMEVTLNVVNRDICRDIYASAKISINERIICAGVFGSGNDSCHGDTGGPLIFNGTSVGITSRLGCSPPNAPALFTKVSMFIDWIEKHAEYEGYDWGWLVLLGFVLLVGAALCALIAWRSNIFK